MPFTVKGAVITPADASKESPKGAAVGVGLGAGVGVAVAAGVAVAVGVTVGVGVRVAVGVAVAAAVAVAVAVGVVVGVGVDVPVNSYAPMSQVPSTPRPFPSKSVLYGGPNETPLFRGRVGPVVPIMWKSVPDTNEFTPLLILCAPGVELLEKL